MQCLSSSPENNTESSGEDPGQAAGDQEGRKTFPPPPSSLFLHLTCWPFDPTGHQASLRQMNQTRLYVQQQEVQQQEVKVGLLVLGLPPLLDTERYVQLLHQHLDIKSKSPEWAPFPWSINFWLHPPHPLSLCAGHLVTVSHTYSSQGQ